MPAFTEMVQRWWTEFKGCAEKTMLQILWLLLNHIQMKLIIEEGYLNLRPMKHFLSFPISVGPLFMG